VKQRSYSEAVDALFTQLPMFQRQGPAAYKANLDGTRWVCRALGNPEKELKVVHVAGTNGKGTVSHMVAAALQRAGHVTGLFTSPHLVDFRERIRVNGEVISEDEVVAFVDRWQAGEGWGEPSFFELTFGMALDHFRRRGCGIVVLETGMGGRLDSTNVVPSPEVCVITNVGLDHQAFLGTTVRAIAREKAGILKDGVPVVLGPMRPEAQSEILLASLRTASEVHAASEASLEGVALPERPSPFEVANRQTAWTAMRVLAPAWNLTPDDMRWALQSHKDATHQAGRWQWVDLPQQAAVVLDGAHNLDGVAGTVRGVVEVCQARGGALHVVWGSVADKDLSDVLDLLPLEASYRWCQADIPRALDAEELSTRRPALRGTVHRRPVDALLAALRAARAEDVVWVGGSLFVVGDVLKDAPDVVPDWPTRERLGT